MNKSCFNAILATIAITGILIISGCGPIIYVNQVQTTSNVPTQDAQIINDTGVHETDYYNLGTPTCDCPEVTNQTTILKEEDTEKEKTNPYIFNALGKEIDFSIGHMEIVFYEGLLSGEYSNFDVVSPVNLGKFKTINEALKLNSRTGLIEDEKYNNLLLTLHSGYTQSDRPLEGEFLRYSMERWGEEEEYVENKLSEVVGSKGYISFDGIEFQIEVIGAIRLQKDESLEINSLPVAVLDIATKKDEEGQYIALGNVDPFEDAKLSHELIINFCGWGPNQQYTYYRYIILVDIKEEN